MKNVSVFYAHRARTEDTELKNGMALVVGLLQPRLERRFGEPVSITVTTGQADFNAYFQGDWNNWAGTVASRRNATTGRLLYDILVCPDLRVGRATGHMLITALGLGRMVMHLNQQAQTIKAVKLVACMDDDDWSTGYHLIMPKKGDTP